MQHVPRASPEGGGAHGGGASRAGYGEAAASGAGPDVLLLDGAHNEAAAKQLRRYVQRVLDGLAPRHAFLPSGGVDDGRDGGGAGGAGAGQPESGQARGSGGAPHVAWIVGVTQGKDAAGLLRELLRSAPAKMPPCARVRAFCA